jgi:EAL domain-containing protein (putative c-di-GMP-specific phosphodiesterase class I)
MVPSFDIEQLLAQKGVATYFQPIASVRRHGAVGFEALSRGCWEGALVPPLPLFEAAQHASRALELDRLCLGNALQMFAEFAGHSNAILFLNCQTATVERPEAAFELEEMVRQAGLETRQVAIEVLETTFDNANEVRATVDRLRERGFLLALDDVGAGHSNLDRIPFVKPDILKADRSLIQNLDTDYYKREVLKSLVMLSEKIGGWIIAEGVETQGEAMTVLDLGGDLMQGYYFARPAPELLMQSSVRIEEAARDFKHHALAKVEFNRRRYDERLQVLDQFKTALDGMGHPSRDDVEARLQDVANAIAEVESVCLLDGDGCQVTDTILNQVQFDFNKSIIFAPPVLGTDHSFKEYFYLLSEAHLNPFMSQPYVPLPTSQLCVTLSTFIPNSSGKDLVLVVHLRTTPNEETILDRG